MWWRRTSSSYPSTNSHIISDQGGLGACSGHGSERRSRGGAALQQAVQRAEEMRSESER